MRQQTSAALSQALRDTSWQQPWRTPIAGHKGQARLPEFGTIPKDHLHCQTSCRIGEICRKYVVGRLLPSLNTVFLTSLQSTCNVPSQSLFWGPNIRQCKTESGPQDTVMAVSHSGLFGPEFPQPYDTLYKQYGDPAKLPRLRPRVKATVSHRPGPPDEVNSGVLLWPQVLITPGGVRLGLGTTRKGRERVFCG